MPLFVRNLWRGIRRAFLAGVTVSALIAWAAYAMVQAGVL